MKIEKIIPKRYGVRRSPPKTTTSIAKLWEDAVELSDAWYTFADDHARERRRETKDERGMSARGLLLQADLISMLRNKELTAVAIRECDRPYVSPEVIPSDFFDSSMESVRSIFADSTRLKLAGRSWVQVRVTECRYKPRKQKGNGAAARRPARLVEKPNKDQSSPTRGRPPIDALLDRVISELHQQGSLKGLLQKERIHLVQTEARRAHPNTFISESRPSRAKVIPALIRAGYASKEGP